MLISISGSVTFVALVEEYYKSQEKQQEVEKLIVEILQKNNIDESTLTVVISGEFTVDTNKYNKVTQTSDVQSKDGKTTTNQATKTEGENCGAQSSTQTSVTNSQPKTPTSSPPPTVSTPSSANASSNSQASSTGNGTASASGQSAANANNGKAEAETTSNANTTGNGQASASGKAEASS